MYDYKFHDFGDEELKHLLDFYGKNKKCKQIITNKDWTINSSNDNRLNYSRIFNIKTKGTSKPKVLGQDVDIEAPIDSKAAIEEWTLLKCKMKASQKLKITEKDFFKREFDAYFEQQKDYELYNILRLFIITLIFAINSTSCERGYSTMNDIKTKKRNPLSTFMLSVLMMIRLNGPNSLEGFEEIYDECFDEWYKKADRYKIKNIELSQHFLKLAKASNTKDTIDMNAFLSLFDDIEIDENTDTFFNLGFDVLGFERMCENDTSEEEMSDFDDDLRKIERFDECKEADSSSEDSDIDEPILPRKRRHVEIEK